MHAIALSEATIPHASPRSRHVPKLIWCTFLHWSRPLLPCLTQPFCTKFLFFVALSSSHTEDPLVLLPQSPTINAFNSFAPHRCSQHDVPCFESSSHHLTHINDLILAVTMWVGWGKIYLMNCIFLDWLNILQTHFLLSCFLYNSTKCVFYHFVFFFLLYFILWVHIWIVLDWLDILANTLLLALLSLVQEY